jgi:hypothetical protein
MEKYLVKLMFQININNGANASQFDEQIRVIESKSEAAAFVKARAIGKKEEAYFTNNNNETVSWQFIDVTDIFALEDFRDGDQVFSNTKKIKDTNYFIKYIRQKSMEIQAKSLTFA